MRAVPLLVALAIGCQSPNISGPHCPSAERTADFTGRAEYVASLDDGTRTAPVEFVWAHEEAWLYAFDATGDGVALVVSVPWRVDASEHESGCVEPDEVQGPATLRSHMRVDWSVEYAMRAAAELVGGELEPVAWFAMDEEDLGGRAPERVRDESGRLARHVLSTR